MDHLWIYFCHTIPENFPMKGIIYIRNLSIPSGMKILSNFAKIRLRFMQELKIINFWLIFFISKKKSFEILPWNLYGKYIFLNWWSDIYRISASCPKEYRDEKNTSCLHRFFIFLVLKVPAFPVTKLLTANNSRILSDQRFDKLFWINKSSALPGGNMGNVPPPRNGKNCCRKMMLSLKALF